MSKIFSIYLLAFTLVFSGCGSSSGSSKTVEKSSIKKENKEEVKNPITNKEEEKPFVEKKIEKEKPISNKEEIKNPILNKKEENKKENESLDKKEKTKVSNKNDEIKPSNNLNENNEEETKNIDYEEEYNNEINNRGLNGAVVLTFIDDIVSNLKFKTDKGDEGYTDEKGQFSLSEYANSITFYLETSEDFQGKKLRRVKLGEIKREDIYKDKKIFIQDLIKISRFNVNNSEVLKIAQLLQSSDKNKNDDKITLRKLRYAQTAEALRNAKEWSIEEYYKEDKYFKASLYKVELDEVKKHLEKSLLKHGVKKLTLEDNPYFDEQWYINPNSSLIKNKIVSENAHINPEDYLKKYTGKGVKIAVIDSHLDLNHEDLKERIVKTHNIKVGDDSFHNDKVHGTAVTGIISANHNNLGIKGIASDAEIYFLRYKKLDENEILELLKEVESWGADIVNASWGTSNVSLKVKDEIIRLSTNGRNKKGMVFVFASGNDEDTSSHEGLIEQNDESNIQEVISVGGTNALNQRAKYSIPRKNLDILAPSGNEEVGIATLNFMTKDKSNPSSNYLLSQKNNNQEKASYGTSYAAPIVSASIALMLEANPSLTRVQIENILKNTADKLDGMGGISNNAYYGYGKLNLAKAIREALVK